MDENRDCYHFEKITYTNCIFDKNIDATYVLHLINNGRLSAVHKQLNEYKPTHTVFILHNQGYKKCNKTSYDNRSNKIENPAIDLVDAYLQIFKHAKDANYNNILILEDDFIFDEKIKDPFHQTNISNFLHKYADTNFIYYLGCIPYLQIPYDYYNYFGIISTGSHSIIYSKKYRDSLLQTPQNEILDWDYNLMVTTCLNRYNYYIPLCYQLFPETENSNVWGSSFNNIFYRFISILLFQIFQLLTLNVQIEPGYTFFYVFSKLLFIFLVFIFIIIVFYSYKSLIQFKSIKRYFKM